MASSTRADIIQNIVADVFLYIEKHEPESHQKLEADSSKKEELTKCIKQIAEDEVSQGEELKHNGGDVTKLKLPEGRLDSIRDGLKMATYKFHITKPDEHPHRVAHLKMASGAHFKTMSLDTKENTDLAYYMQLASIVIEGIMLFMTVIGLDIPEDEEVIKKSSVQISKTLAESSAFREAVLKFVEAWKKTSGYVDQAKALYDLMKETYSLGILWTSIKSLCSEMSWWDWTKAAALISAQLIAAFATEGLALAAKIGMALKSAYDFGQKIANLDELQ